MYYPSPKHTSLYRLLIALKSGYRYALLALVIALFMHVWFLLFYRPIEAHVCQYRMRITALIEKNNSHRNHMQEQKNVDVASTRLRQIIAQYPTSDHNSATIVLSLINTVMATGLIFVSCTSQELRDEGWAIGEPITLVTRGSLQHGIDFLKVLVGTPILARCLQCQLSRNPQADFTFVYSLELYRLKAIL